MKRLLLSVLLICALVLCLLPGCSKTADAGTADTEPAADSMEELSANPSADPSIGPDEAMAEQDEILIVFSEDGVTVNGKAQKTDNGELTLSSGGLYRVTGTAVGRLVVDAADTEDVTLILDGCDLTWPDDEVIYFKTAGSALVILADGSENVLVSGSVPDEDAVLDEEATGACLRSKCPMTITGGGALTVCGYINNGIAANGDFAFEAASISVVAVNDGVKSKSNITIRSGSLAIEADMDGIQADGALTILGGTIDIHTGAGTDGADMKVSDSLMMGGGPGGGRGRSSDEASGEAERSEASDEANAEPQADAEPAGASDNPWDMDDEGSPSRKGLKAVGITILGGSVYVDAEDDGIHSDGSVTISGGDVVVRSGDDGVHADEKLTISDGSLEVQIGYEGLEAKSILIEGGLVDVTGSDDGMNVNGGSGFGFGSREASEEAEEEENAASAEEEEETTVLRITGGTVYVNSGGDGLDSNGSLIIEGGNVFVSGPTSNWDTALDKGDGSGSEFIISGGVVMAGGSSGMAESPEATDVSQPSILYAFSDFVEDGALCTLTDKDGNVILSYNFGNSYNCVILSSPDLVVGETYILAIGDQQAEITLDTVSFSNRGFGFGGFPGGSRDASRESGASSETEPAEDVAG